MNFRNLIVALIVATLLTILPSFAQTEQEILRDALYAPKFPIGECKTWALTDGLMFEYTSTTATAATVTFATPTLTITINGVPTTYNTSQAAYDTPAELVAALEAAHTGLDVSLGDQTYGDEDLGANVVADHVAVDILNVEHGLNWTNHWTFCNRLYMDEKRPVLFRLIANTTYGSGNSVLYIYSGQYADAVSADTLVWKQTLAATTVDKDLDLHPYMLVGPRDGYLKVVIKNSAALTAGNMTFLGAYR